MSECKELGVLIQKSFDSQYQKRGLLTAHHTEEDLKADGVTIQTTPVTYERLLEIARKMHCWIFLSVGDEQKVYDELGLTDEENAVLGYSGQMVVSTSERG